MQNQLQRAINLAKKTGDKLVIFDSPKAEDGYVVLTFKDYENLILGRSEVKGLTEDELLDKINHDIAIWKSELDNERVFEKINKIPFVTDQDEIKEIEEKKQEENFHWLSDDDDDDDDYNYDYSQLNKKSKRGWSIPSARKQHAEEVIEEDRQYLEEVPF
ncbi:MAG: hypothetical protein V1649_03745 [Patescibacteria group bacterium]